MSFILNRRLFTDATQTQILEDGDPAAAFLIGGRGTALYDDVAKKYGLDDSHRLKEDEPQAVEAKGAEVETEEDADAEVDLESMTKAELLAFAKEYGYEVKANWSKPQILEVLSQDPDQPQ